MFLPLILLVSGLYWYFAKHGNDVPKVNPPLPRRPGYQVKTATPLPDKTAEFSSPVPGLLRVDTGSKLDVIPLLREYGFWHEERLLYLLSHRPENPEKDDEFHCPANPEVLRQRQEFWLKSGVNSIVHQRQMLKDDPVMQYLALDMILSGFRKLKDPDDATLERWLYLVNIQRKILPGIR